ncbi:MAG: polymer-forming cytoskeletal protein [Rhodoferax sp.]|jgi:cytoskeletal protein CcmA (bactofilin family)|nr:polymer-forming cytoskeletal protein [Rhodoferax sp.]
MNTLLKTVTSTDPRLFPAAILQTQATVLPKSATMKGDMAASEDLSIRLDGEYNGKIELGKAGSVHIANGAVVTTDLIIADFIYVEGTVNGKIHARKGMELSPTAKVKGAIQYDADLDMHPGARISGQINGPETSL